MSVEDRPRRPMLSPVELRPQESAEITGTAGARKSRKLDPADRFKRHVASAVSADGSGCHTWCGSVNSAGYGLFAAETHPKIKTVLAHRFAVFVATGEWPPADKVIRHACDNRRCVRPSHLVVGTVAENNQDMHDRGRHPGTSPRQRDSRGRLVASSRRLP